MNNHSNGRLDSAKKNNRSKDKLATMLDSTAMTNRLFGDATMNSNNKTTKFEIGKDSISIIQPTGGSIIATKKKLQISQLK